MVLKIQKKKFVTKGPGETLKGPLRLFYPTIRHVQRFMGPPQIKKTGFFFWRQNPKIGNFRKILFFKYFRKSVTWLILGLTHVKGPLEVPFP